MACLVTVSMLARQFGRSRAWAALGVLLCLPRLSPAQIAKNVDSYLATLNARGKARVQLALIALAS